ncbi:hypothetical protein Misp02_43240 [Microtetraspora sp. NBRC 16547]|nr:hypothetical protein Misp02_43240 [Microtetraspora sp. NBRC 16547]
MGFIMGFFAGLFAGFIVSVLSVLVVLSASAILALFVLTRAPKRRTSAKSAWGRLLAGSRMIKENGADSGRSGRRGAAGPPPARPCRKGPRPHPALPRTLGTVRIGTTVTALPIGPPPA